MQGPFAGGDGAGSDQWWKHVIYRLLKNVSLNTLSIVLTSGEVSGSKFGTTRAIRLQPLTGISPVLFSFLHAEQKKKKREKRKENKDKEKKKKKKGRRRAIKASLEKKLLRGQVCSLRVRPGLTPGGTARPAREGSGGGTLPGRTGAATPRPRRAPPPAISNRVRRRLPAEAGRARSWAARRGPAARG